MLPLGALADPASASQGLLHHPCYTVPLVDDSRQEVLRASVGSPFGFSCLEDG